MGWGEVEWGRVGCSGVGWGKIGVGVEWGGVGGGLVLYFLGVPIDLCSTVCTRFHRCGDQPASRSRRDSYCI